MSAGWTLCPLPKRSSSTRMLPWLNLTFPLASVPMKLPCTTLPLVVMKMFVMTLRAPGVVPPNRLPLNCAVVVFST